MVQVILDEATFDLDDVESTVLQPTCVHITFKSGNSLSLGCKDNCKKLFNIILAAKSYIDIEEVVEKLRLLDVPFIGAAGKKGTVSHPS